jgi:TRAP-type mannitol/chloroaromatic compound transport system substrate-binding protein
MTRISRCSFCALLLVSAMLSSGVTVNCQTKPKEEPFVADYYYKAKWGYADEFIALFLKNHYPILRKQMQTGRILSVTCVKPRYHSTEDGRWDYRVTIVFKNMAAASDQASEEPIIKQLFPDQETYKKEEQRRFEILLGHWDTPIVSVPLEK